MRTRYADGIAWGEMKTALFEYINEHLMTARDEYRRLMAAPDHVESVLQQGAQRARAISVPVLAEIRDAVGIRPLG
jgi:tryptophanyl-tRNA synthetase